MAFNIELSRGKIILLGTKKDSKKVKLRIYDNQLKNLRKCKRVWFEKYTNNRATFIVTFSETGHKSCPAKYYIKCQCGGGFDWLGKDGRHAIKQSYFKDREPWPCQGFRARPRSD